MYARYSIRTGVVSVVDGDNIWPIGTGGAGSQAHWNDPDATEKRGVGPLPVGVYRMGVVPHPRFKAPAIRLTQIAGESYGRSGFFIHGGTKSEGCILLQYRARRKLAAWITERVLKHLDVRP